MKSISKIIFLCLQTSVLCPPSSFSQTAPGIEWQNTIGGNYQDALYSIYQTADGGYISGGGSRSNISGDKTENNWDTTFATNDFWIVKTDSAGNIQWQNTIGGSSDDNLYSILESNDGGYILAGTSVSDISGDKTENCNGGWDYWIVKTDSTGNIQWQHTIGGNADDHLFSIQQTTDGGYILGGHSRSDISGDKTENAIGLSDYWLVKTDSSGSIQWQNTIGGSGSDLLYSVQQTIDGGYILGGWSQSNISGDKTENSWNNSFDYWLVKTDSSGSIQWQNTIGGSDDDALSSVLQTADGGYVLGGDSYSDMSGDKQENAIGLSDYWLVKTDSTGNIQWQNTIGGSDYDWFESIVQTTDSGYALGGYSKSNVSGDKTENSNGFYDYWIVKTDTSGNILWQNTIGGNVADNIYSLQQTTDGGYILGGLSYSNISGDKTENTNGSSDYWIIKLGPDTTTGISPTPALTEGEGVTIAPNPLVTQSKLTFKNPNKEKFLFTLYDITGRVVETDNYPSLQDDEIILTKGSKQPGVYLFNLVNEKTEEKWNGKIVISN